MIIKNASPEFLNLGTDDQSARKLYPSTIDVPSHCPKLWFLGKKGTTKPNLTLPEQLSKLYGNETFNVSGKYYNHATLLLTLFATEGNTCMTQRVVPDDAGAKANCAIYIDVLPTTLPNYLRSSTGALIPDAATNGYKIDPNTPTVAGYKIKFIKDYVTGDVTDQTLGLLVPKQGTMSDGGTKSTMYPFLEILASEQGEAYNNNGFYFTNFYKGDFDTKIVSKTKTLPYGFSLVTRESASVSPTIERTLFGETYSTVVLKDKVVHPTTNARLDLPYLFKTRWFNETDNLKELKYNEYDGMYLYKANLELILKNILVNEKAYVSSDVTTYSDGGMSSTLSWYDFTTSDQTAILDEIYLLNIFTCKSTANVRYQTVAISDDVATLTGNQSEVSFSSTTPVYLSGGSDGTISDDMFEKLVQAKLAEYADQDALVQDTAINVESVIYDSGFSVETKKAFANVLSIRKDVNVALTTHEARLGAKSYTLSESRDIASALKTRLSMAPESSYFGTQTCRAIIVGGAYHLRVDSREDLSPQLFEIAIKSARMMGASNGNWKAVYLFDKAPNSLLEFGTDPKPEYIPMSIKPTLWSDGLVWSQPYDRTQYHFPAIQTIYDDDTSVLNSWWVICALPTVNKVAEQCWRDYTGSTALTDGQFIEEIETYCKAKLKPERFANMFELIPSCVIDDDDKLRGYSWHLNIKLYANNMKSKMVYNTTVYRMSDLENS